MRTFTSGRQQPVGLKWPGHVPASTQALLSRLADHLMRANNASKSELPDELLVQEDRPHFWWKPASAPSSNLRLKEPLYGIKSE